MTYKGGQGNKQGNNTNNNNQIWIRTYIKGLEKSNEKLYAILSFPAKSLIKTQEGCYLLIEGYDENNKKYFYALKLPKNNNDGSFKLLTRIKDCKISRKLRWIYIKVPVEDNLLNNFPLTIQGSIYVKLNAEVKTDNFPTIEEIKNIIIIGIRKFFKVR